LSYAITRFAAPVLNTDNFKACFGGKTGDALALDTQLLLRPVETVLFPYSKVQLLEKRGASPIWRIRTNEYCCEYPIYIDERFVARVPASFPERNRPTLTREKILQRLKEQIGARYIWGGNWPQGIPQLLHWYKPSVKKESLENFVYNTWQLKGVDCSGLLYFACHGSTPRNTSELISWGKGVPIAGKDSAALATLLHPLDLLVWKGHVVIVMDDGTTIESKGEQGVVVSDLKTRLQEILKERHVADAYTSTEPCFVARRWAQ
jgi:hypothetical protein